MSGKKLTLTLNNCKDFTTTQVSSTEKKISGVSVSLKKIS